MALGSRDYGDIQDVLLNRKPGFALGSGSLSWGMWPWQAWRTPAVVASVPGRVAQGPEQWLPGRGRVNSPWSINALNPSPWQIKAIRGTSNPQSPTLFKSAQGWLGSFGQGTGG